MKICIAGKNDIACRVLRWAKREKNLDLCVVINQDDTGVNTWQDSLLREAEELGVEVVALDELYNLKDLIFISVEFDKIIRPSKFKTRLLYNIHFSLLPKHRGVSTSIWALLEGDENAGVTFHQIDKGIDTGDIVEQASFSIPKSYNARDLYFRLMAEGELLVKKKIIALVSGQTRLATSKQDESLSSCHYRKDIDFSDVESFIKWSPEGVINYLRAFDFFEYQEPTINGLKISNYSVSKNQSKSDPGSINRVSYHQLILSTSEVDLDLEISPYDDLFSWACGNNLLPEGLDLTKVPDLDRCNIKGWNALILACYHGNIVAVEALLDAGANVNYLNRRKTTPLMYSRSSLNHKGGLKCFEALLGRGADYRESDVDGKKIDFYLRADKQFDFLKVLQNHIKQI